MRPDVRQLARWIAALPAAWLVGVILAAPSVTPPERLLVGGLLAVSFWDPSVAVLLVAALTPIGAVLAARFDSPRWLPDALVLTFLVGWLARPGDRRPGPRLPAAAGVAAVFLVCDYLWTASAADAGDAARIIEGLALVVAVVELFRRRPVLAVRLPTALAAGLTVCAAARDVRGAASAFAMMLCVSVGMAARARGGARVGWAIAGLAALSGLWPPPGRSVHHTFARIAGEAGLLGASLLAAFLGVVLWAAFRGLTAAPRDLRLLGCAAGVLLFIGSSFAGDPLLTPQTAVPFWLVVGLTMALAGSNVLREREAVRGVQAVE